MTSPTILMMWTSAGSVRASSGGKRANPPIFRSTAPARRPMCPGRPTSDRARGRPPEHAFFAIWAGHGYPTQGLDYIPVFEDVHHDREYYLLEGPVTAVTALRQPGRRHQGSDWRQPDLWWPADHAWIVATDVDIWCNYVGGTSALTEAIADTITTETHRSS